MENDGTGTARDARDDVRVTADEVLDALGHAVIVTDPDGVITLWNRAAERLYGWPREDAVGRNVAEVTVPELSREVATDIMTALNSGVPWSGGFPVRRRDGGVFHALVTDTGLERAGRLTGVVGVSTDLGDALRPLLERSSDAALLLSRTTTITYASPAVTTLFGWEAADVIGQPFLDLVHPEDREEWGLRPGVRAGRIAEVRVRSAEGWVWVEAATADLSDDPLVRGMVCNLHYSERLAVLKERERISASVHADVLQALFGASLELEQLRRAVGPELQGRVNSVIDSITDAGRVLRETVASTAPSGSSADPDDPDA